ncbi:MAG TPA: uracil-DNA glycosylase [Minicystis sp.]|nr:uracil-DNA glycosylase [Minicystis sp.]
MTAWDLPPSWRAALGGELEAPYFAELRRFVAVERAAGPVYPPDDVVFAAFGRTPLDRVKVVLLGQDPYHGEGQAHGLALSVRPGVAAPPSLVNLFKELEADLAIPRPAHGSLAAWAERGVLLLNAVLTVRAGAPGSHAKRGWEAFTDAAIRAVDARARPAVFLLLGAAAKKKARLVDRARHRVVEAAHPSPLSAHAGFFGSKPFSRVNAALRELGEDPIDFRL